MQNKVPIANLWNNFTSNFFIIKESKKYITMLKLPKITSAGWKYYASLISFACWEWFFTAKNYDVKFETNGIC